MAPLRAAALGARGTFGRSTGLICEVGINYVGEVETKHIVDIREEK